MPRKYVAVYGCSKCGHKDPDKSNWSKHFQKRCRNGERIIVKQVPMEEFLGGLEQGGDPEQGGGPGQGGGHGLTLTIPPHTVRRGPAPKDMFADALMRDVVDMQDIDTHLSRLEGTDEGKQILFQIVRLEDQIKQFLCFITYVIGLGAPPEYRSVAFLTCPRGESYICWKDGGHINTELATDDMIFKFFQAAFVMFDSIMIRHPSTTGTAVHRVEAEYIETRFKKMCHRQPGQNTARRFKFQDVLLRRVRDSKMTEELLVVTYGILPCLKIQHVT